MEEIFKTKLIREFSHFKITFTTHSLDFPGCLTLIPKVKGTVSMVPQHKGSMGNGWMAEIGLHPPIDECHLCMNPWDTCVALNKFSSCLSPDE